MTDHVKLNALLARAKAIDPAIKFVYVEIYAGDYRGNMVQYWAHSRDQAFSGATEGELIEDIRSRAAVGGI